MPGKARVRIYPEQVPDNDADASYLLQEGFEKRLAEYLRGDFGLCGVRAVAEIEFPSSDGWVIIGRLESPGVWGLHLTFALVRAHRPPVPENGPPFSF